jgi:hypothetical protein
LLAHAIRAGWSIPAERRDTILQEIGELCLGDDDPKDVRRFLAASLVFLRANEHNMQVERMMLAFTRAGLVIDPDDSEADQSDSPDLNC